RFLWPHLTIWTKDHIISNSIVLVWQYPFANKFLCRNVKACHSSGLPRSNEGMRLLFSAVIGVMLGYLFGISFPTVNVTKLHFPSSIISYIEDKDSGITTQTLLNHAWTSANSKKRNNSESNSDEIPKVLKALHLALLCLKQTFIFEDCGVNLVRILLASQDTLLPSQLDTLKRQILMQQSKRKLHNYVVPL
ncbi:Os01g0910400, partial [Oryza sativa Japonica Group]